MWSVLTIGQAPIVKARGSGGMCWRCKVDQQQRASLGFTSERSGQGHHRLTALPPYTRDGGFDEKGWRGGTPFFFLIKIANIFKGIIF